MPGPPFAFGSILVILALLVSIFIPDNPHQHIAKSPTRRNTLPMPVENIQMEAGMSGKCTSLE